MWHILALVAVAVLYGFFRRWRESKRIEPDFGFDEEGRKLKRDRRYD